MEVVSAVVGGKDDGREDRWIVDGEGIGCAVGGVGDGGGDGEAAGFGSGGEDGLAGNHQSDLRGWTWSRTQRPISAPR